MATLSPKKIRTQLSRLLTRAIRIYYKSIWGMNIGEGTRISSKAILDKTNPEGINIGEFSYVTFGCAILSHDMCRRVHLITTIGDRCFIGCNSIVMPGVTIGDHCIIGAGSVVVSDIPSGCAAAGNPAKIIRKNIRTSDWGVLIDKGERVTGEPVEPAPARAAQA